MERLNSIWAWEANFEHEKGSIEAYHDAHNRVDDREQGRQRIDAVIFASLSLDKAWPTKTNMSKGM